MLQSTDSGDKYSAGDLNRGQVQKYSTEMSNPVPTIVMKVLNPDTLEGWMACTSGVKMNRNGTVSLEIPSETTLNSTMP
jgi:hypothetical protein